MSNANGDGGAAAGANSNSQDHSAKPNGTQSTELNQGIRLAGHAFEGRLVRTVLGNSHGWFVAPDLCRGIGLRPNKGSYGHHIAKIDDDDKTQLGEGWATAGTPTPMFNMGVGGVPREAVEKAEEFADLGPDTWLVSESGLYTLILRSRAATTPGTFAHRFRRWVTREVLPSIRKTGQFGGEAGEPHPCEPGRYVEIVLPDGRSYRYETPIYSGALQEFNEADVAIFAHQLSVIAISWARAEQFRALDLEVKGRMLTQLRVAIENGNRMASEYLEWFQEAKLNERNID